MKVYFYNYDIIKTLSQYKRTWIEQIYYGIIKYSTKIKIVNEITEANIIFTIVDYVELIESQYNIAEKDIKLVILSCQDSMMLNKCIITNPNVIYIFDHLKLSNVLNDFCFNGNNYSQYLLNKYYQIDNVNYINDDDIELKKLYMKKTCCIINTSKIYSRIFESSSSNIEKRKYDITFVGSIDYGKNNLITNHRTDLVSKLKEISTKNGINLYLGDGNDGNKIPLHKFHRILKNTKIFISPWGWEATSSTKLDNLII